MTDSTVVWQQNLPAATGNFNTMHTFDGDGDPLRAFEINFSGGYIMQSHVKAYMMPYGTADYQYLSVDFVNDTTVRLSSAVPVGWTVTIYRDTPKDVPMASFTDGALITAASLDRNAEQAIFGVAEMVDRFTSTQNNVDLSLNIANEAKAESAQAATIANSAKESADAAVRVPSGESVQPLPSAVSRSNKIMAFDTEGNPTAVLPESGSAADVMLQYAAPGGAGLIGTTSGSTVQSELNGLNLEVAALESNVAQVGSELRSELDSTDGASMIGAATYADIRAYSGTGTRIACLGRDNAGDGSSGLFTLDPSDTTTADDDGIVLVGVGGKRWKRQFEGVAQRRWFGIADDQGIISGWDSYQAPQEQALKTANQDIAVTPDDVTIKNRAIKAFRKAAGIKDGAVAAAFVIGEFPEGSNVEPSASVTGFENYEDIGKYPGRDAVALFAQAESAKPMYFGDGVFYSDTLTSETIKTYIHDIKPGMILDVDFGTPNWKGAVILDVNTTTGVLTTSSWRKIDGTSALTTQPPQNSAAWINRHNNLWAANFNAMTRQNDGATQAIGIETGLSLLKVGSGTGSKAYYAVNLSSGVGEDPEYGFMNGGRFQKAFSASDATICSFESKALSSPGAKHCDFKAEGGRSILRVGSQGIEVECTNHAVVTGTTTLDDAVTLALVVTPDTNLNLGSAATNLRRIRKVKNVSGGNITVQGTYVQGDVSYAEYFSDGNTWIQLFSK